jgi:hypothetical protein
VGASLASLGCVACPALCPVSCAAYPALCPVLCAACRALCPVSCVACPVHVGAVCTSHYPSLLHPPCISEGLTGELSVAQAEITKLRREAAAATKAARSSGGAASAKDMRLQRSVEEVARLKARLAESQEAVREAVAAGQDQDEGARAAVKRLERQNTELVAAFKKQMRLIDILKRQKIHMEAARLLTFTEDQFAQTLERGGGVLADGKGGRGGRRGR